MDSNIKTHFNDMQKLQNIIANMRENATDAAYIAQLETLEDSIANCKEYWFTQIREGKV